MDSYQNTEHPAVLVTGGSGFIGKHLVLKLASEDFTVVTMYNQHLPEPRANVYPVCTDMGSSELIAAPLRGVDCVVHLAWIGGLEGSSESIDLSVNAEEVPLNIKILKNLILAMERAGTRRIIFLSAIGASKNAENAFLREKYLAEFYILNSKIPEKIIIRSSVVFNDGLEDDKFIQSILRIVRKYPGIYPVPFNNKTIRTVFLEDLITTIKKIITVKKINGNCAILEITESSELPLSTLFKLINDNYVKSKKLPIKGFIAKAVLPLFERDSKSSEEKIKLPKLKEYLNIETNPDPSTQIENPLSSFVPEKFTSIKDSLSQ